MADPLAIAESSPGALPALWRRVFVMAALVIVVLMPTARLTGRSDLHDQTQERTSAYTTDLVLHASDWRRWILPRQQGQYPATKPPLYNWIAAPFVWWTDGHSEWPHHMPSLLAYLALCTLLWRLGDRLDPGGATGPLASIILATNYAWFKLSVLVRPDTLLSLWLALGWVGVTVALSGKGSARKRSMWSGVTWISCALAMLTKGPPALVIPLFAVVLGWVVTRRALRGATWGLRQSGALWGVPLVLVVTTVWLGLVWRIDPGHLYNTLIREEFVDRAMGTGAEGVKEGPWDLVRTAANMPLYFVTRFVPWSVLFFGALIDLWKGRPGREPTPQMVEDRPAELAAYLRYWMISGVTYAALVVVVFTLSAGKRADYIASAYISAALVTAWCLTHLGWRLAARRPALILAIAAIMAGGLIVHERINGYAAQFPLADSLWDFARQVRPAIESEPLPLEFYRTGVAPLQVMLQRSQPVVMEISDLADRIDKQAASWLVVSDRGLDEVTAEAQQRGWRLDLNATSQPAKGSAGAAPLEMRLYHVTIPTSRP